MNLTQSKTLHLSDFKSILFDIDRTLIPPTREIFPEVITMLNDLHKKGVVTGVCTGRGYASIANKFMTIFPDDAVHIMAGGSLVISNTGKVLWEQSIEPETLNELKKVIESSNSTAIFMKPDGQYAQGEVLENINNHPWNQVGKDLKTMSSDGVGLVYIAKPSDQINAFLEMNPNLSFKDMQSNNGYQYYDITAKGVTKAKAMDVWSTITNIPVSKIIGFGDSLNDLEFLQKVGFSVAMGNAEYEIKNIATKVIGDVTNKSLPNYVQNILKGEPL